jgi:plastocyanin
MRKGTALAIAILFALPACGEGLPQRVVLVDHRNDEFASHYWRFFPATIYAHPGDEVVFDQQWTGEPHTVTFGSVVEDALDALDELQEKYRRITEERGIEEGSAEAAALNAQGYEDYQAIAAHAPLFDPYRDLDAQNVMRPCYLRTGRPPTQRNQSCPERSQPEFTGTYSYYSSGFIAPSGDKGNEYRIALSDDLAPGTYRFFCVIHTPEMQGRLVVKPATTELPSSETVVKRARREIQALSRPLSDAFEQMRAGKPRDPNGEVIPLPAAGYHAGGEHTTAIDEFVPKTLRVKVNDPVTWTVTGAHTISFDVPRYVPIYRVRDDGTVDRNPVVDRAAGGSPEVPPVDFSSGPVWIDGGSWDGSGFMSSGLLGSEPTSTYTLRVTKPGRYRYACLIHPPMVATLVVER